MANRYTAIIKIVKVEEGAAPTSTRYEKSEKQPDKDIELASLVVRNSTLAGIIDATKLHLDLIVE
jgi:hypothetical protein